MYQKWRWTTLEAILLQKTASEGQKLWYFPYRALWSTRLMQGNNPPGNAID